MRLGTYHLLLGHGPAGLKIDFDGALDARPVAGKEFPRTFVIKPAQQAMQVLGSSSQSNDIQAPT